MDECVVCRRKVQRTENYVRCHLWAGLRRSTGDVLRRTYAAKASSRSKAQCGKRAAWPNRVKPLSNWSARKGVGICL